jgi:hypothetical protein
MSSFENQRLEVPQHSPWHLVTGSCVLLGSLVGSGALLGWLFA